MSGGGTQRATPSRIAGRAAGAVLAAAAVIGLDALALWQGPTGVVVVTAALLALPVARDLAARVALTGVVVLGWWPLTWWVVAPDRPSRIGLGLAVVVGALAWYVAGNPTRNLRRLVPRVAPTDATWLTAGAVTAWLHLPWLRPGSAAGALQLMASGWDHSAHYNITAMQRTFG